MERVKDLRTKTDTRIELRILLFATCVLKSKLFIFKFDKFETATNFYSILPTFIKTVEAFQYFEIEQILITYTLILEKLIKVFIKLHSTKKLLLLLLLKHIIHILFLLAYWQFCCKVYSSIRIFIAKQNVSTCLSNLNCT